MSTIAEQTDEQIAPQHQLGAEVFVYGADGGGFGRITAEPHRTPLEVIFGHPSDSHRVVSVQMDSGEIERYSTLIVVAAEAARGALHAVKGSKIVAGGPGITREKLMSLPDADTFEIIQGLPA